MKGYLYTRNGRCLPWSTPATRFPDSSEDGPAKISNEPILRNPSFSPQHCWQGDLEGCLPAGCKCFWNSNGAQLLTSRQIRRVPYTLGHLSDASDVLLDDLFLNQVCYRSEFSGMYRFQWLEGGLACKRAQKREASTPRKAPAVIVVARRVSCDCSWQSNRHKTTIPKLRTLSLACFLTQAQLGAMRPSTTSGRELPKLTNCGRYPWNTRKLDSRCVKQL